MPQTILQFKEEPKPDNINSKGLREVYRTSSYLFSTVGMGKYRYARESAAKMWAELHILGYPDAEIEIKSSERSRDQFGNDNTLREYLVFSDAPEEIAEKARGTNTYLDADDNEIETKAKAWGLMAYYAGDGVKARRLFAVAGMFDMAEKAFELWDETDKRAFEFEIRCGMEEYAKSYRKFYFGKR